MSFGHTVRLRQWLRQVQEAPWLNIPWAILYNQIVKKRVLTPSKIDESVRRAEITVFSFEYKPSSIA